MCKHAVRKLPYSLRYVPDQYQTQNMCDKAVLENDGTSSLSLIAAKFTKCVIK